MSLERFFDSSGYYRPIHSAPLWYSSRPVELCKAELRALVGILADAEKRVAEPRTYSEAEILAEFGGGQ